MPRITAPGVIPDVDLWRTALVSAGGDPLAALAEALFADGALGAELRGRRLRHPHLLAELFATGGNAARRAVRGRARARRAGAQGALHYDAARPARLLIAVDQVERLFVEAEPERVEAFARCCAPWSRQGLPI